MVVSDVAELVDERADPRRWGDKQFNYIEISDIDSQTCVVYSNSIETSVLRPLMPAAVAPAASDHETDREDNQETKSPHQQFLKQFFSGDHLHSSIVRVGETPLCTPDAPGIRRCHESSEMDRCLAMRRNPISPLFSPEAGQAHLRQTPAVAHEGIFRSQ